MSFLSMFSDKRFTYGANVQFQNSVIALFFDFKFNFVYGNIPQQLHILFLVYCENILNTYSVQNNSKLVLKDSKRADLPNNRDLDFK